MPLSLPTSSSQLFLSPVPSGASDPRSWYLSHPSLSTPMWLSASSFLGPRFLTHLLRNKKPLALGVKYVTGDAITNMEGALHTFATPFVHALMHGDYRYKGGHGVSSFRDGTSADGRRMEQARPVVISGLVNLDFESWDVMWELVRDDDLESLLTQGSVPESIDATIDTQAKRSRRRREEFDRQVRRNTRLNLLRGEDVPHFVTSADDRGCWIDMKQATDLMVNAITSSKKDAVLDAARGKWMLVADNAQERLAKRFHRDNLSLHLLFLAMLHQVRNEHVGLERVCGDIARTAGEGRPLGYVYTFNPPVIFRQVLGDEGKEFMTTLHAAALRHLRAHDDRDEIFKSMRVFAYSDFQNPLAVLLMKGALHKQGSDLVVMKTDELYAGKSGALYSPPPGAEECILVIHNNSDGFGDNVEFEYGCGSLDAVIGEYSNMAACLHRDELALHTRERMMRWSNESLFLPGSERR